MPHEHRPADHGPGGWSIPAVVTFWLLGIWTLMIGLVFALAFARIPIEGVLLGVLSGIISTQTTALIASISYWVGTTSGAKGTADQANAAGGVATAALAQLAGAGPQPPAVPLEPKP